MAATKAPHNPPRVPGFGYEMPQPPSGKPALGTGPDFTMSKADSVGDKNYARPDSGRKK